MDVEEYCAMVRATMFELEEQNDVVKRIVFLINACADSYKQGINGGNIYIIGNGGSSSVASHFAQGLCNKGYNAKCLSDSTPIITGIANDYDYQYIFSKQLSRCTKDDIVIAFSVSGNSKNICNISGINATIIGVFGNNGGRAVKLCKESLVLSSMHFQSVEDVFSIVAHILELEIKQINE